MNALTKHSRYIHFKKKQTISRTIFEKELFLEVFAGGVKLYTLSLNGEEILTDIALKGDFLRFYEQPTSTYGEFAIALVDTDLKLDIARDKNLNQAQDPILSRYNRFLAQQTVSYRNRLINACTSSALSRLNFIYKMYDVEIIDSLGNSHRLVNLLTYKELASLAGVTRQTAKKYSQQLLHK